MQINLVQRGLEATVSKKTLWYEIESGKKLLDSTKLLDSNHFLLNTHGKSKTSNTLFECRTIGLAVNLL